MKKYFISLLFFCISGAQAAPGCTIPPVTGKTYHQARAKLIEAGFKPVLLPAKEGATYEAWAQYGYDELKDCAPTGAYPCLFGWKDGHGRAVTLTTAGDKVRRAVCE